MLSVYDIFEDVNIKVCGVKSVNIKIYSNYWMVVAGMGAHGYSSKGGAVGGGCSGLG